MTKEKWEIKNIPDQKNKIIIITGATSGLGKEATRVLTKKNATVIMAVRNTQKAKKVATEIRNEFENAKIDIRLLDLGSLDCINLFAKGVLADYKQLDVLINNAGVMMCPYSKTKDGFEIQMGTNHLGPFALTGLMMPLLLNTGKSRVVSTSSLVHRQGDINFDDVHWESRDYNTGKAYSDSKLANLYFTLELVRKYRDNKDAPIFTTAHPGGTNTELSKHTNGATQLLFRFITQKVEMGILPTLRAAFDIDAVSGNFYGPKNFFEMRGYPVLVKAHKIAQNEANAKKLWEVSEQLTNIKY